MKYKKIRNLTTLLLAGLAMIACSPEDYSGVDGNIPQISDYTPVVTVDQDNNIATFNIVDKNGNEPVGVYPIWEITTTTTTKTTVNGYKTPTIILAGDYTYTLKVGNRNGISAQSVDGTFTINTTRYDFSDFVSKLTDNSTKEWRIYSAQAGHMGCGESITNPANWWSAGAEDKSAEGIYDDRVTFTANADKLAEGTYTYSAGDDGLTFCNTGVTTLGITGSSADYSTPCVGVNGAQTTATYSLAYDSSLDMVTITLPAKTLFPYMASDAQMSGAYTLYVSDINTKTMTCVLALESICWQFIFVNGEDAETTFDVNQINWCETNDAENIGNAFNQTGTMNFWFADANWSQVDDPDFSYVDGVYTITTKTASAAEWQGQCSIPTTAVNVEAGEFYDFSCKIIASEAVDRITIKINKDPDDDPAGDVNTLFYKNNFSLKAGENTLRYAKITPTNTSTKESTSFDQAKFVLDIGGCAAGVTLKLSDIIIQKHNPK